MKQTDIKSFFKSKRRSSTTLSQSKNEQKKHWKRSWSLKKNGSTTLSQTVNEPQKPLKRSLSLQNNASPMKSPKKEDATNVQHADSDDEVTVVDERGPVNFVDLTQQSDDSTTNSPDVVDEETASQITNTPSTSIKFVSKDIAYHPSGSKSDTPRKNKFYSPAKRRWVSIKPQLKRCLSFESTSSQSKQPYNANVTQEGSLNDKFVEACNGMDNDSIFLLNIIQKYLNDSSILHLLGKREQELLEDAFTVSKPGMKLVCRLFWRQDKWHREESFQKIVDTNKLHAVLECLMDKGWIIKANGKKMNLDLYMELLKKNELIEICSHFKIKTNSKQNAMEALRSFSKKTNNITGYFSQSGNTSNNLKRLLEKMSKVGPFYKLSELARATLHKLHVLMYLGMDYWYIREKKLELALMGVKNRTETFPVDPDMELDSPCEVFQKKEDFDSYVGALEDYEAFIAKKKPKNWEETQLYINRVYDLYKNINADDMLRYQSLPIWLRRYTRPYMYVKILEEGVIELKRLSNDLLCLDILTTLIQQDHFRQHKKQDWFVQKSLIFDKLDRYDESAEVLLQGFRSNIPDRDKDFLRKRALILIHRKTKKISSTVKFELLRYMDDDLKENQFEGEHIFAQSMEPSGRGKLRFKVRSPSELRILDAEHYCLLKLRGNGEYTHGEHWEGKIVTTLFYLLFWDIIFSKTIKVRGAFLSYYQQFPLDLHTDDFYKNRRNAIDERLTLIATETEENILERMREVYTSRPECELSGISFDIRWEQVYGVVRSLYGCSGTQNTGTGTEYLTTGSDHPGSGYSGPGTCLAYLLRKYAQAPQRARAGFPDLTLWNEVTRKIIFVEVKTDDDKPSVNQLQWMHYLKSVGIPTKFCYLGTRTLRQKARNPNHVH